VTAVVAPRNLQISPNQSTYKSGNRIQCSAEGKPTPSYHWTDLFSGTIIRGAVLVISETMVDKNHTFQCTARNKYNNISISLNFSVEGIIIIMQIDVNIRITFSVFEDTMSPYAWIVSLHARSLCKLAVCRVIVTLY